MHSTAALNLSRNFEWEVALQCNMNKVIKVYDIIKSGHENTDNSDVQCTMNVHCMHYHMGSRPLHKIRREFIVTDEFLYYNAYGKQASFRYWCHELYLQFATVYLTYLSSIKSLYYSDYLFSTCCLSL